ncbi:MAG TPA: TetR/AcrR family transcriptional regulator [Bacilli bacterium]|nr:TetR/AcrR family transcriptional regulator [Bacilli bacterium]
MQLLKPHIREKIVNNARDVFFEKGYSKTSMRLIARKSKITVGNIYRYFKNKEALFDFIVLETYSELIDYINRHKAAPIEEQLTDQYLTTVLREFSEICIDKPKEIVIILERYFAGGSYESLAKLEKIIHRRLLDVIPTLDDSFVKLIVFIMYKGVLYTLQNEPLAELEQALNKLFKFIFQDIVERVN